MRKTPTGVNAMGMKMVKRYPRVKNEKVFTRVRRAMPESASNISDGN
jgi:hypothetical protein